MTDSNTPAADATDKEVPLTQEQKEAAAAEKYRAQFNGGDASAQVVEDDTNEVPQRPDHIPEKFWDAEKGEVRVDELAKSYSELEKGKSKSKDEPPANETPEEKAAREASEKEALDAQAAARETLGLPSADELTTLREALTEKMLAGEEFSDDDYAPWEKMGLDRDTVDTFKAGLVALGEVHKAKVYAEVGGEEAYTDMIDWARSAFSKEEIEAYDRDVHSRDTTVAMVAVRGLAARYREATGRSGRDITSNGSGKAVDGYTSKAEMVADMRDPRYAKDAAFREEVARKVHAAAKAGVNLMY